MNGHFFGFSEAWQSIINTGTAIVTFLMVFLIQTTQNRNTKIIDLKLDELIVSIQAADNKTLDLTKLTDQELEDLEKYYKIMYKKNRCLICERLEHTI